MSIAFRLRLRELSRAIRRSPAVVSGEAYWDLYVRTLRFAPGQGLTWEATGGTRKTFCPFCASMRTRESGRSSFSSHSAHPFLVAAAIPAMKHGERRIHVAGAVCPMLRNGLETNMQRLRQWYGPERRPVTIESAERYTTPTTRTGSRTGGLPTRARRSRRRCPVPTGTGVRGLTRLRHAEPRRDRADRVAVHSMTSEGQGPPSWLSQITGPSHVSQGDCSDHD